MASCVDSWMKTTNFLIEAAVIFVSSNACRVFCIYAMYTLAVYVTLHPKMRKISLKSKSHSLGF